MTDNEANNQKRDKEDYVIASALNTMKVLEALEGARFEGVSLKRVAQRTGFSNNFCFRALKTLQVMGYARETAEGWKLGGRLLVFSESFNKTVEPAVHDAIYSAARNGLGG